MSISKKLLKTTNLSLQDIADQLGFTTKSYFIHTFSVFTGKTPLKYREDSIFS
ncbi:helix-turn-helix domain-containing protein [Leuconostoc suionicum]|uniref:helix-turn-helix domain-containing protein n=1 Tax=Leuconostoc suionicum TaxID=1511761 RepID=UPI003D15A7D7